MSTAYHPAFGAAVNYTLTRLPDNPDRQVAATVAQIVAYIKEDAQHPRIQEIARSCYRLGGGDPVLGVWKHVKQIRFEQDWDTAQALAVDDPRKPNVIEVLIRPIDQAGQIDRGNAIGDCDCFQLYGLCLLTALGIPAALVTVAADSDRPKEYSHVYGAAYPNGQRLPLDFSHGPHPGWECNHLGKIREWPIDEGPSLLFGGAAILAIAAASYWCFTTWSAA